MIGKIDFDYTDCWKWVICEENFNDIRNVFEGINELEGYWATLESTFKGGDWIAHPIKVTGPSPLPKFDGCESLFSITEVLLKHKGEGK